jgi:histidinol-phosphate/aromatic aminotransferase/cobyric acid decarboxylase-like protein
MEQRQNTYISNYCSLTRIILVNCLRVTVDTAEENRSFLRALEKALNAY